MDALSNKGLPRWWLADPTWDYPIPAVRTMVALGKREAVFPMLKRRFDQSLQEDDYNDIFSNVLLIAELGDPRGERVFEKLKRRFAEDENALSAVEQFESTFRTNSGKELKTEESNK